jgi:hypothetical protein
MHIVCYILEGPGGLSPDRKLSASHILDQDVCTNWLGGVFCESVAAGGLLACIVWSDMVEDWIRDERWLNAREPSLQVVQCRGVNASLTCFKRAVPLKRAAALSFSVSGVHICTPDTPESG